MSSINQYMPQILPLVYLAAMALPFALLRLRIFGEDWRFRKNLTAFIVGGALLMGLGGQWALWNYFPDNPLYSQIYGLCIFFLGNLLLFWLVKLPLPQQLFVHMLLLIYYDLIATAARYGEHLAMEEWGLAPYLLRIGGILTLILLTHPLVNRFRREVLTPLMVGVKTTAWNALWLLPAALFAAYYPAVSLLETPENLPYLLLLRLIVCCSAFPLISCVLWALEQVAEDAAAQEHGRMVKKLLAAQEEQNLITQNCIADTKSVKQDYKLNVIHIKNLLNQHAYTKLSSFLTYGANAPIDTDITYCDIPTIDALVRYYKRAGEKHNIRLTARLSLPRSVPAVENDLAILLGNCMANALEEGILLGDDADNKFVELRARQTENSLAIVLENSYASYAHYAKRETLYSDGKRSDPEGVGAACIAAIVERYGGTVKYETPGGGITRTSITFTIPPIPPTPELPAAPGEAEGAAKEPAATGFTRVV